MLTFTFLCGKFVGILVCVCGNTVCERGRISTVSSIHGVLGSRGRLELYESTIRNAGGLADGQ